MPPIEEVASKIFLNDEDTDWEQSVNKENWSDQEEAMFRSVVEILDLDHLARLSYQNRPNELLLQSCVIEKSAARMRKVLANVFWDTKITQWIHGLLMQKLPVSYMVSYLEILGTLRKKVPSLLDKMLLLRPITGIFELLGAYDPCVNDKVYCDTIVIKFCNVSTNCNFLNNL